MFKSYTTMKKVIQRMVHIEASQGSFGVVLATGNVEFGEWEPLSVTSSRLCGGI